MTGKVEVWYMTEEERLAYIEKHPIKPRNRKHMKHWSTLSRERYLALVGRGFSDRQILKRFHNYTMEMLEESKGRWGIE